jgi:hypothetical protein
MNNETGEVFTGVGTGTRTTEKVPFILRRRRELSEIFFTIYDFSGDGSAVENVEIIQVNDHSGAIHTDAAGIAITDALGQKSLIGMDLSGKSTTSKLLLNGIPFERLLFKSVSVKGSR